jgi:hypothetical protein
LRTNSLMTATSPTVFTVANTMLVQDTSRIVLNSLSGFRLVVGTLDLSSVSSISFGGAWTLDCRVALLMRAGSVISGDGSGFGASLGCGVAGATGGSGGRLDGQVWLVFAALPVCVLAVCMLGLCCVVLYCVRWLCACLILLLCVWCFGVCGVWCFGVDQGATAARAPLVRWVAWGPQRAAASSGRV